MSSLKKAILITYPFEDAIKEATSLADTVGYSVERIVRQRHITRSKYGIGRGKEEEVKELVKKLEKEEKRRELHRIQRSKAGLSIISIAGYTSAGKTTLFNTLTGESKNEGQGLFTTLSTFTRAMKLNTRKVLVSDTVGFISKLPAYMIDAFKSTLHELTHSDLILLVLDISQSIEEMGR